MTPTPINQSGLKLYKRSPAHYRYFTDNPPPSTAVQQFGTAYHTYVLENAMFAEQYTVLNEADRPEPDKTFASKENKQWLSDLKATGKNLLEAGQLATMNDMNEVLLRNKIASALLTGEGVNEQRFNLPDMNGCPVYGRPDRVTEHFIIDLKTVQDASPEAVQRTAAAYGWHIQASFYLDCMYILDGKCRQFVFIIQEKTPPYMVSVHVASEGFISYGQYEYERLLRMHLECCEREEWPGYESAVSDGINELHLPAWAVKEYKL